MMLRFQGSERVSTLEHVSQGRSGGSPIKSRPGFLNFSSVSILGQIIPCYRAVLCMFSSIPGLYLLDTRSSLIFSYNGDNRQHL